ncbi:anti-sigma regulatory factor [Streptomyces nigra]|uniref:anti-sigma regulatory factor n=1 Tax=Streptomyces nigra TaxID=1827580 RepID=UPI00381BE40A
MTHSTGSVSARLPLTSDLDLVRARQHVRQMTAELGFSLVEQTKLVTAASELARNALVHGGGGRMECTQVTAGGVRGLRLVFSDDGPGIADLDQALSDGYTSGEGLGMGLPGARRLVHEFSLDSARGQGTTVTVTSWVAGPPRQREAP